MDRGSLDIESIKSLINEMAAQYARLEGYSEDKRALRDRIVELVYIYLYRADRNGRQWYYSPGLGRPVPVDGCDDERINDDKGLLIILYEALERFDPDEGAEFTTWYDIQVRYHLRSMWRRQAHAPAVVRLDPPDPNSEDQEEKHDDDDTPRTCDEYFADKWFSDLLSTYAGFGQLLEEKSRCVTSYTHHGTTVTVRNYEQQKERYRIYFTRDYVTDLLEMPRVCGDPQPEDIYAEYDGQFGCVLDRPYAAYLRYEDIAGRGTQSARDVSNEEWKKESSTVIPDKDNIAACCAAWLRLCWKARELIEDRYKTQDSLGEYLGLTNVNQQIIRYRKLKELVIQSRYGQLSPDMADRMEYGRDTHTNV